MRARNNEVEISLTTLFEVLFKKIPLILVVGIVFGLLGFGWATRSAPVTQYKSTLSVFVVSETTSINSKTSSFATDSGSNGEYASSTESKSYSSAKTLSEICEFILKTPGVLDEILTETGLTYSIDTLSGMLSVSKETNIPALSITVTAKDADEVDLIMDAVVKVLPGKLGSIMGDGVSILMTEYSVSPVEQIISAANTAKNAAVGAILGVFLAAAVIVVKFLLSGQLIWKASELPRFYPELPVVAVLPNNKRRGKTSDEEYRFAAANLMMLADEDCSVVGFTGIKEISAGAVNKIAEAFSSFGKKACVVDAKTVTVSELEQAISSAKAACDYVIVELPSIGSNADAVPAAKLVEALTVLVKTQQCTVEETDICLERLGYTSTKILGFVAE